MCICLHGLALPTSSRAACPAPDVRECKRRSVSRRRRSACWSVTVCRHAGRSRVQYTGAGIHFHLFKRDFFITMLQASSAAGLPCRNQLPPCFVLAIPRQAGPGVLPVGQTSGSAQCAIPLRAACLQLPFGAMAAVFAAIYLACYFFFGFVWWLLVR